MARLDLARFFLAQAMAAETLAVLGGVDDRQLDDDGPLGPARQGLTGADLLMGRLRAAEHALASGALDHDPEIALWRAALAAAQHRWDRASRELGRSENTLATYPPVLQLRLGLPAAMIALETHRTEHAFATLDGLAKLDLHPSDRARLRFIRGLAQARIGRTDEAIALWQQVERSADEETRIKASFAMTTTLLDQGRSTPEEALAGMLALQPL